MRKILFVSVAILLLTAPPAVSDWTLVPCGSQAIGAETRAAFRRALAAAPRGSALYTPNAFPKSDAAAVDNFVYYHRTAFADTPASELRPGDRRFFELLAVGGIRFEVLRVVNWTPLQCGAHKERAFYFVLRAYDRRTGEELLRASVEDNGHVARVRHKPADTALPPIPPISAVVAAVENKLRTRGQDAQYVATWGTLQCDEVQPCVGFRAGGASYVIAAGETGPAVRVDATSARLSLRRDFTAEKRGAVLESIRRKSQDLVSLGADTFVVASRVLHEPRR